MSVGGECCWMLTFVKWLVVVWLTSRLLSLIFLIFLESISAVIRILPFHMNTTINNNKMTQLFAKSPSRINLQSVLLCSLRFSFNPLQFLINVTSLVTLSGRMAGVRWTLTSASWMHWYQNPKVTCSNSVGPQFCQTIAWLLLKSFDINFRSLVKKYYVYPLYCLNASM